MIAHDYVSHHHELDREQKKHLKLKALSGNELVDSVARLCVMNLYLHGVGGDDCPIDGGVDSLAEKPSVAYDTVLTNPPFGKKSSITVINEEGEELAEYAMSEQIREILIDEQDHQIALATALGESVPPQRKAA